MLLKSDKAALVYFNEAFCRVGKRSTNQLFVVSTLPYDCFLVRKCRVVDVWGVKAMFLTSSHGAAWPASHGRAACTVIDRIHGTGYAACNY